MKPNKNTYDPLRPITPVSEIGQHIILNIDRKQDDGSDSWLNNYRLIENIVCRDNEIDQSAIDPSGDILYVALAGEVYDLDELAVIEARLREHIGRVAAFNFKD